MAARRISRRISAQEFTEALKKNVTAHGESAVIDPYRQNVVTVRHRDLAEISPSRASHSRPYLPLVQAMAGNFSEGRSGGFFFSTADGRCVHLAEI